ncbi:MAG: 2,3-bisphosphoglycerate-independent phosphoglycerate mutase [Thermoanaerobaculales bacterium]|jgi:2,3-bisphosphoglycerate-independent phosphoglycerate mutase|nr:2,3-bisphosphoglycerate-independent phosphoglycerate mutase [Thermoanaerobaculales bacterium]
MDQFTLARNPVYPGVSGPLLLVILDGVGLYRGRAEGYPANAVDLANTPVLDRLIKTAPVRLELAAHGPAVGMPGADDMGNSEVGHNAIGAGRVFAQGAKLVADAIASGAMFRSEAWLELVEQVSRPGATYHLIGLLSDGNVHSHIDHLEAMVRRLARDGVRRIRIHALADGRDVDPVTFDRYLERLEAVLGEVRAVGCDAAVASGGGRMTITMDRYNANWEMVRRGWETHVHGAGRGFLSAGEAVATLRRENPGVIDQDLPPFVVHDPDGRPIGTIEDGDSVVFFNFRGDRAIEISLAFTSDELDRFDRGRRPEVRYAGMMEYDGDLKVPARYLVAPPAIERTVSEYLVHNGVTQLATAETQKFGHVTYFWNGNNSGKFDPALEDWIEVPSDVIPFEKAPAMKAREVCAVVETALAEGRHRFLRVNFANGDMVGHTGVLEAAIEAMEVVDECLGRIERAVARTGSTMIVTADHGNLDMMLEVDSKTGKIKLDRDGAPVVKTSHTLSPVPWLLVGRDAELFRPNPDVERPGLGNIAATLLLLLGFEAPPDYLPPLVVPAG